MASIASTARYDVEKFDGQNDFGLWKMKMRASLGNFGLEEALDGKAKMLETFSEEKKKEIDKKAFNTLILGLGDKVLQEVSKMTTAQDLWKRLETLYMTKTLSKRLILKTKFFSFKMCEGQRLKDYQL